MLSIQNTSVMKDKQVLALTDESSVALSLVYLSRRKEVTLPKSFVTCPVCKEPVDVDGLVSYNVTAFPETVDCRVSVALHNHSIKEHKKELVWNAIPSHFLKYDAIKDDVDRLIFGGMQFAAHEEPICLALSCFGHCTEAVRCVLGHCGVKRICLARTWLIHLSKDIHIASESSLDAKKIAMQQLRKIDVAMMYQGCSDAGFFEGYVDSVSLYNRFQLLFYQPGIYKEYIAKFRP
jgi:hypothetical protein